MPADPAHVKSLFLAAADLPVADRPAFIAAVSDPDERAELQRLLLAHHAPDARLDATLPAPGQQPSATLTQPPLANTAHHSSGDVGQLIAERYKLLERIGEGGMGTVWMAEQRQPVKRLVAVKLIKPGLDTKAVLARFEAERQALAIMDHPSIARVLDAGETSDGRPFFVMELVKGMPITRYCDEAKLTPRQRLELFVPVCQAIQHAHTKGVIHRDIKPGNVLVALYDGRPVPKVIDFGIAKAAGQTLTDKTLHTGFGAVVGTPEYMSPEQASLNNLDVDTRSDVYALGVLLYELLTGGPPFSHKELQHAGLLEMLRVVREQEPPRPSARLSTSTKLASLAATRGTEPARLAGLVRGEVDWIVMKALEKDRNRRYETATGLAADVRRHLDGEPVQAVPPSVGYRLRKFVRRHRTRVAVGATVLLALVAGLAGTGWQAVRASRAERLARAAEAEAVVQKRAVERTAAGFRVDLDLAQINDEPEIGLLRLARTYRLLNDDTAELQRFVVTTVITVGQQFAGLTPSMTYDGIVPDNCQISPDARTVLAHRCYTRTDPAELIWLCDTMTGRRIATLYKSANKEAEIVKSLGFSPDGKIIYTGISDGTVSLWENPSGRLRWQTDPAAITAAIGGRWPVGRWLDADFLEINDDVLLTSSKYQHGKLNQYIYSYELWDMASGQLRVVLATDHTRIYDLMHIGDQYIVMLSEKGPTRSHSDRIDIFSTKNGALIKSINNVQPEFGVYKTLACNPQSSHIIVISHDDLFMKTNATRKWYAQWFSIPNGHPGPVVVLERPVYDLQFLTDSAVVAGTFSRDRSTHWQLITDSSSTTFQWITGLHPHASYFGPKYPLHTGYGTIIDHLSWQMLVVPSGRRFHPNLSAIAADGLLVPILRPVGLLDVSIEKVIPLSEDWVTGFGYKPHVRKDRSLSGWRLSSGHLAGQSLVHIPDNSSQVHFAPTMLAILPSTDILELWAQVAVRGELGPDGGFVKWDEPTWQRKWEQLAALPPPFPDFPFPGHLARDPLHWLRKEFESAADAAKLPLARELLRRAEATGDHPEAARWRREIAARVR